MSKELRELLAQLDAKKGEVRSLMSTDVEAAEKAMGEVRSIQKQIELQKQLDEQTEGRSGDPVTTPATAVTVDEGEYRSAFIKVLRNRPISTEERELLEVRAAEVRAMSGSTDEDGGLVIPKDVQTQINEYARAFDSLEQFVTVEPVTTRSGSRVLEKNADMVPFVEITELGNISETDNPKFETLTYAVKDYAGILPLSRSLLQDSDQAILRHVTKWMGKKSKITRNVLILNLLKTLVPKPIASIDDIKDVLNVDLDPAIAANAIILTNQDGFNYLDKLKDSDGKYILQPDPTNATRKLFQGNKPVAVVANRFLPTATGKAPIFIGDLKEAIVLFKRENLELASTEVGGDAFKRNSLDVRGIQRDDLKLWDAEAVVYGQIVIATV